jgi:nucleotide-binding universal stress UspA family protein
VVKRGSGDVQPAEQKRSGAYGRRHEGRVTLKILVAIDGSEYGQRALEEVVRIPWPAASEIRVISAAEMPFFPSAEFGTLPRQYYEELEQATRDRARRVVEEAVAQLRKALSHSSDSASPPSVEGEFLFAPPREAIVEEAHRWGADWIVLGSHGYRGYKRFLLGSVSQSVAANAPCSVLIVRKPEETVSEA